MPPSRQVVRSQLQFVEGGFERGKVTPRRGPAEGSAEGASSEAETWRAAWGLGGETSSEAKVALQRVRPRKSRTVALGRGPSVHLGFLHLERILGIQA